MLKHFVWQADIGLNLIFSRTMWFHRQQSNSEMQYKIDSMNSITSKEINSFVFFSPIIEKNILKVFMRRFNYITLMLFSALNIKKTAFKMIIPRVFFYDFASQLWCDRTIIHLCNHQTRVFGSFYFCMLVACLSLTILWTNLWIWNNHRISISSFRLIQIMIL